MGNFIDATSDLIKVCTRYYSVGLVVTFTYLALPPQVFDILHAREIAENHRPHMFQVFILSSILAINAGIRRLRAWNKLSRIERERKLRIKLLAKTLTEDEKEILRFYIGNKVVTNLLCSTDSFVQSLEHAGFIRRVSEPFVNKALLKATYRLDIEVRDHLHEHPELLKGKSEFMRNDAGFSLAEYSRGLTPKQAADERELNKLAEKRGKHIAASLLKKD